MDKTSTLSTKTGDTYGAENHIEKPTTSNSKSKVQNIATETENDKVSKDTADVKKTNSINKTTIVSLNTNASNANKAGKSIVADSRNSESNKPSSDVDLTNNKNQPLSTNSETSKKVGFSEFVTALIPVSPETNNSNLTINKSPVPQKVDTLKNKALATLMNKPVSPIKNNPILLKSPANKKMISPKSNTILNKRSSPDSSNIERSPITKKQKTTASLVNDFEKLIKNTVSKSETTFNGNFDKIESEIDFFSKNIDSLKKSLELIKVNLNSSYSDSQLNNQLSLIFKTMLNALTNISQDIGQCNKHSLELSYHFKNDLKSISSLKENILDIEESINKQIQDQNEKILQIEQKTAKAENINQEALRTNKLLAEAITNQKKPVIKDISNEEFTNLQKQYLEFEKSFNHKFKENSDGNEIFQNKLEAQQEILKKEMEELRKKICNDSKYDNILEKIEDAKQSIELLKKEKLSIKTEIKSLEEMTKGNENIFATKFQESKQFYESEIANLKSQFENFKTENNKVEELSVLPNDLIVYFSNYQKKFDIIANKTVLCKDIRRHCLPYRLYPKIDMIDDKNFILYEKDSSGNNCFQVAFSFNNKILSCKPIIGATFWKILNSSDIVTCVYSYVKTYAFEILSATFLNRDEDLTKRVETCKLLIDMGLSVTLDDNDIERLIKLIDKDDDENNFFISSEVLIKKPKWISSIYSKNKHLCTTIKLRNELIIECVKFYRSCVRYNSKEEYAKKEPLKCNKNLNSTSNFLSYEMWNNFSEEVTSIKANQS
ncbi:hypothetical protein ACO0SA_002206 [Hanseniaspora valbyensis]